MLIEVYYKWGLIFVILTVISISFDNTVLKKVYCLDLEVRQHCHNLFRLVESAASRTQKHIMV